MDADTSQVPGCFPARGPVLPPRTPSTRRLLSRTGDSGGGAGASPGPEAVPRQEACLGSWVPSHVVHCPGSWAPAAPLTIKTPGSGLPWGGLALLVRVAPGCH